MNKIKIASGIIALVTIFTACGSKEASKESVKLVGAQKEIVVEEKKEVDKQEEQVKASEENKTEAKEEKSENKESSVTDSKSEASQNDNSKVEGNTGQATPNQGSSEKTKEPIPNISYKLEGNIIVIDPGHASKGDLEKEPMAPNSSKMKYKQTGGAQGVVTKTPEYEINMQVAKKLKAKLEEKGYTVIMTKTDNNKTMSNIERAKIGNEANASLVVRIHADSADSSSASGASMLVPGKNEFTREFYDESKLFGKVILNTLTNEVGMRNRGVIERNDITGFNWSEVPVVLVEMGFLSNPDEDKLLSSSSYQEKIAHAIANGIEQLKK